VPASDRDGRLPPSQPKPLANLQNQVITAVRGAISDALAGHEAENDLTGLDLDFSVPTVPAPLAASSSLPVLRAEPGKALASVPPVAQPRNRNWRIVGLASVIALLGLAAGVAIGVLREPPAGNAFATQGAASAKTELPPPALPETEPPTLEPPKPEVSKVAVPKAVQPVAALPAPAAPAQQPPATDNLETAHSLVAAGQVAKARELLLTEAAKDRPEAAWLLARSFDPNYLASLPAPDAKPDAAEARRWYTRWYDLASKRGEVPQTMRLDLLLRSLDAK
jgi:hypothetical protein